jgi:hypothetical protein
MRSVVWPSIGVSEVVDQDEPSGGSDDVVVDVSVSMISPGTERARLLGLPTAAVRFPHIPGYLAAGSVRLARSMAAGTRVAVRGAGHQSVAVAPVRLVRAVPDHVPLVDAAVWQLALTAMYGLALGEHRAGEPVAVVGAGLLGVVTPSASRGSWCANGVGGGHLGGKGLGDPSGAGNHVCVRCPGQRRLPLVLDVTGSAEGLATAITATVDGGRVVLLGSPRADIADVPLQRLHDRRLRIVGVHIANLHDIEEPALSDAFFDLLASGRFTIRDVLSEHPAHDAPLGWRGVGGGLCSGGVVVRRGCVWWRLWLWPVVSVVRGRRDCRGRGCVDR